jgi:predicted metalloenzyme YecM
MDSIRTLEIKENFYRELRLSIERWRTMPKEEQDRKSREFYEFAKKKSSQSISKLEEKNFMEKLDDAVVTRKLLDLTKKEIKSDITTLRLETKQMGEYLKSEMAQLKQELRSDMSGLKQELRSDMAQIKFEMADSKQELKAEMTQLKQELRNEMVLLTQKMEANTAKLLVAIEEQNNNWRLLYDHYGQIYANQTDHGKRLDRLEMSTPIT